MAAPLPPTPIVSMRRGQSVTSQMGGVYSVLKGLGRGRGIGPIAAARLAMHLSRRHSFSTMRDDDHPLTQSALLSRASPGLQRMLKDSLAPLELKRGQVLFDQGDLDDRLFVLDSGLLEVSVMAAEGRKLSLNLLRPGDIFGEIAIFDPGPRTARIEALESCSLRAIRREVLFVAMGQSSDLMVEIVQLAGRRLRWMSQQMEQQVFLSQPRRLAARLLFLTTPSGEIRMSQAQLADYVGVTREAVSKTLSDWRQSGIVEVSRGRIVVRDAQALQSLAESDAV